MISELVRERKAAALRYFKQLLRSWRLSVVRSVSPHLCVMKQQAGAGGWTNRVAQPAPKPE